MMRRLALLAVTACSLVLTAPALAAPPYSASVQSIPTAMRKTMTPTSWRPGCPVSLDDLRLVSLAYVGFDGKVHRGRLIVNRDATTAIVGAFRTLYDARFPIRQMVPVDAYGGDDFRSIEADNTSSFNCRPATGSSHWSNHAYGRAIDVNPIENPYISGGSTSHHASVPYLNRSRVRLGMAVAGGTLVRAFAAQGWGWGGSWSGSTQDTQHFSYNGR
jgi:D-alanyl-D-alanine carboxypeptidase